VASFYRYLFGAIIGELWTMLRDERNLPMVMAMFGASSIEVLLDEFAGSTAEEAAVYQQISTLLKRYS
jgi:hypothetical protein